MVAKKADVPANLVWIILIIVVAIIAAIAIATIVVPGIGKGGDILSVFSSTAEDKARSMGSVVFSLLK